MQILRIGCKFNSNFFDLELTNLNFCQFEKLANLNLKVGPLDFDLVSFDYSSYDFVDR